MNDSRMEASISIIYYGLQDSFTNCYMAASLIIYLQNIGWVIFIDYRFIIWVLCRDGESRWRRGRKDKKTNTRIAIGRRRSEPPSRQWTASGRQWAPPRRQWRISRPHFGQGGRVLGRHPRIIASDESDPKTLISLCPDHHDHRRRHPAFLFSGTNKKRS